MKCCICLKLRKRLFFHYVLYHVIVSRFLGFFHVPYIHVLLCHLFHWWCNPIHFPSLVISCITSIYFRCLDIQHYKLGNPSLFHFTNRKHMGIIQHIKCSDRTVRKEHQAEGIWIKKLENERLYVKLLLVVPVQGQICLGRGKLLKIYRLTLWIN